MHSFTNRLIDVAWVAINVASTTVAAANEAIKSANVAGENVASNPY